jgi:hypothetical protein
MIAGLLAVSLTACKPKAKPSGHQTGLPGSSSARRTEPAGLEKALQAWQQGDQAAAVARFLETDLNARPLFSSASPLSLGEAQSRALPASEREAKTTEAVAQINQFKQLLGAVAQEGRTAAAQQDYDHARKCFAKLIDCGDALSNSESLLIMKLVGQAAKKKAEKELAPLRAR